MKFLLHAIALPALLVSALGCVKLTQTDTSYQGAVTMTGQIQDADTGLAVSGAEVSVFIGDTELVGTVDGYYFTIQGVPTETAFTISMRASGYIPLEIAGWCCIDPGVTSYEFGSLPLAPTTTNPTAIEVELVEGHGMAFTSGTLLFQLNDPFGGLYDRDVLYERFDVTSGTVTIPAGRLYAGEYANYFVYMEDGVDANGVPLAPVVTLNGGNIVTITEDLENLAFLQGLNSGDYPTFNASFTILESASYVTVNTDGTCTYDTAGHTITAAAGQSATWTLNFKEDMLLNYFWFFDDVTNQNPGFNGLGGGCATMVGGATIAITPATIFTTGSNTVTITITGLDGTAAPGTTCGPLIDPADLEFSRVDAAGTTMDLYSLFLTGGMFDNFCGTEIPALDVTIP